MKPKEKSIAPLTNVKRFCELLDTVTSRPRGLPGIGVFHGHSGLGKTWSATFGAIRHRAHYVEVRSVWTSKPLLEAICLEMGVRCGTRAQMVDRLGVEFALADRPLILDEADTLADKKPLIEIVRDLYESGVPSIVLIGEESLPQKLGAYERVHGRVLQWTRAEEASLEDAQILAEVLCGQRVVGEDLLALLHEKSGGSTRRLAVNLSRVAETAKALGLMVVTAKDWLGAGHAIYTGMAPKPRRRAA